MSEPAPLKHEEEKEAEQRTSVRVKVVHEAIRRDGEVELHRPWAALWWSGLAAGLSMGTSLLAQGLLRHYLPQDAHWLPLVVSFGYPVGYFIAILGRQQLFTENTLTPIIPLMGDLSTASARRVGLLWMTVLAANLAGAWLIAWFFSSTDALKSEYHEALLAVARDSQGHSFSTVFLRGIPAGWLIAMIVWLRAAMDTGEIPVIAILTFVVGVGGFTHVIAGSVDFAYLVTSGAAHWTEWALVYLPAAFLGNIAGGVSITAALNHAQVRSERNGADQT